MHLSGMKYGSARLACLGLFLVCAMSALAQEPVEAKEDATDTSIAVAAHETNEGTMYNVPLVPAELQKQGTTAAQTSGAGLQGNFFQRLGEFYWRDWTGKLPSSPGPERRALDAPH